jgi:hypothetical protein
VTDHTAVLEKTITLSEWSKACLLGVARLASVPGTFRRQMRRLEGALKRTSGDIPNPAVARRLSGPLRTLYETAAESAPLARLFQAYPRFSDLPPADVAAAACLADARPHPTTLLTSRDVPFVRVFTQLTAGAEVSAETLVQEDFAWLLTLAEQVPEAMELAIQAAREAGPGPAWTQEMLTVERELEQTELRRPAPTDLSGSARKLVEWARTPPVAGGPPAGRARLLLGTPRLSMLLREEVNAFNAVLPKLRGASGGRAQAARASATIPTGPDDPRPGLEFRVWAARYFIQLRKFTKLDALFRRWPKLGELLYTDRTAITTLEAQLISPQTLTDAMQRLWDECREDKDLMKLLAFRPLFLHIDDAELRSYMLVSQALAAGGEAALPSIPTAAAAAAAQAATDEPTLLDVVLEVAAVSPTAGGDHYDVSMRVNGQVKAQGEVVLSWKEVETRLKELPAMMRGVPVDGAAAGERPTRQDLAFRIRADPLAMQIEVVGRFVFERLLPDTVRSELVKLLQDSGGGLRILWKAERGSQVMELPLEALWVPAARMFPALSRRHSVARVIDQGAASGVRAITRPLRVLAVFSNPLDSARLNVQAEAEVMRRVLEPAKRDGRVHLEVLSEEEATLERLQGVLRTFQPHIFHYVGHGTYQPELDIGALILHSPEGPRPVPDADVVTLLQDAGIHLAVLNGCETGRTSPRDAVSGIAALLVHRGIPAVIAPVRMVADDAAILFSREFYRTLVDGHPLEDAVAEARKALNVEHLDWTLYALFTSTADLRSIRLPPAASRAAQA